MYYILILDMFATDKHSPRFLMESRITEAPSSAAKRPIVSFDELTTISLKLPGFLLYRSQHENIHLKKKARTDSKSKRRLELDTYAEDSPAKNPRAKWIEFLK